MTKLEKENKKKDKNFTMVEINFPIMLNSKF